VSFPSEDRRKRRKVQSARRGIEEDAKVRHKSRCKSVEILTMCRLSDADDASVQNN